MIWYKELFKKLLHELTQRYYEYMSENPKRYDNETLVIECEELAAILSRAAASWRNKARHIRTKGE